MLRVAFIFCLVCLSAAAVCSQGKVISEEEFAKARSGAHSASYRYARRIKIDNERHWGGDVVRVVRTLEYDGKGNQRVVRVETQGDKSTTIEMIEFKKTIYCRTEGSEWVRSRVVCFKPRPRASVDSRIARANVQDLTKDGRKTRAYRLEVNSNFAPTSRQGSQPVVTIHEFQVGSDGKMLSFTAVMTSAMTGGVLERTSETYEYDNPIQITAPIK